ncbi:unnamed protein product [Trichobilharzia szidati]|nr:unnamed protein product [Trichobilharzia szidati]
MQLTGTFDVKLGKSFLHRDPTASSYMTMRCDFMPASVDRSQPGSIRVNEGNEVVVNMPNVTSTTSENTTATTTTTTTFRGTARSVQKECILIYNKNTHEVTLERIAHTVQLKKTREGRNPETSCPPKSEATQKPANDPEMSNTTAQQQSSQKKTHSRTLSSSSSGSSGSNSSGSCDMDVESSDSDDDGDSVSDRSDSTSSTLSSLSSSKRKKSVRTKPPSSHTKCDAKAASAPVAAVVVNSNSAAHRKLIEHDLKLSDSDSDCCSD